MNAITRMQAVCEWAVQKMKEAVEVGKHAESTSLFELYETYLDDAGLYTEYDVIHCNHVQIIGEGF